MSKLNEHVCSDDLIGDLCKEAIGINWRLYFDPLHLFQVALLMELQLLAAMLLLAAGLLSKAKSNVRNLVGHWNSGFNATFDCITKYVALLLIDVVSFEPFQVPAGKMQMGEQILTHWSLLNECLSRLISFDYQPYILYLPPYQHGWFSLAL